MCVLRVAGAPRPLFSRNFSKLGTSPLTDETCRQENGAEPSDVDGKPSTKDDSDRVEVQSPLIAGEIKQQGTDSNFAGTSAGTRTLLDQQGCDANGTRRRRHDAKRACLHADALTETYVKPPHPRDKRTIVATEELHVRHAPRSSGLATHCTERWCSHWLAQLKQPCAFVRATLDLDMVVHLNDLIAARCGEDPLSQKLNENLELVQKARLGPGYDSEATVLNRSVMYSDAGLTREADLRHAELAVARLRLQAARPQKAESSRTHHWTTKNWSLMGRQRITACQQD